MLDEVELVAQLHIERVEDDSIVHGERQVLVIFESTNGLDATWALELMQKFQSTFLGVYSEDEESASRW